MNGSQRTAPQRVLRRLPLVLVALVACAGISLSAGDANAGLSPGQSCAVKKLKASEQGFAALLKCVETSTISGGFPPGPCIQAAGARLTETFVKLEAKGGCVTTADDLPVRRLIEATAGNLAVLLPRDPPCTAPGHGCGACGGGTRGTCFVALPAGQNRNVCIDHKDLVDHICSGAVCSSDADCPKGEACFQAVAAAQGGTCCTICSGCYDNNPCTQDIAAGNGSLCLHVNDTDNNPCSDGNFCNGVEGCAADGTCLSGTPPRCNDKNPCTADSCDPIAGCINDPAPLNESPCTTGGVPSGHCSNGVCK
jgi:Dictyostelium (slime mold) repeat